MHGGRRNGGGMPAWTWWLALALALAGARARELDPAACAARFDVQRDKIIRTEESREMGARYLAELDVGSRAECLRLCCETDACDVFVFEEKSPGSCYLFKCGPPEDFRCKFTAHGNFSSGVLALSRRLAELQDQERLAHHEREPAAPRNSIATSTAEPTPQQQRQRQQSQPQEAPAPLPPHVPAPGPLAPPRRCSRYQFECRRGGECIAVYNACDGVPQCADGSDEAPELGCPAAPATPPPPPTQPTAAAPAAPAAPPAPPAEPQPAAPRAQVAPGAELAADGPWPRRLAQAQRRFPGLMGNGVGGVGGAGDTPHIFSHQGGLLQPALAPAWPRRAWPPDRRDEADNMDGIGRAGGAGGSSGAGGWEYSRQEPWAEERRGWPVPPRPDPEVPVYVVAETMPELPVYPEQRQQTALRDAPKKGFELQAVASAPAPPAAPAAAAPRTEAAGGGASQVTEARGGAAAPAGAVRGAGAGAAAAHAARAPWGEERDGPSERPPAAVLLLVLGSLLTAALGALLACRARAARRRRRAHPRLALDADYLVNGMYL